MSDDLKRTSKFLSLILRHDPGLVGITLDPSGWVSVDDLLEGCRRKGQPITVEQLQEVVRSNDKQRFAFSEDGKRIRANQGHSVPVELGYTPAAPPEVLYHGTAEKYLESIRKRGLEKGKRHHVHLSERRETAAAVGSRHGKLVMIEVASGQMHLDGIPFYRTPNGVWLTDQVPVAYLTFPAGRQGPKGGETRSREEREDGREEKKEEKKKDTKRMCSSARTPSAPGSEGG